MPAIISVGLKLNRWVALVNKYLQTSQR